MLSCMAAFKWFCGGWDSHLQVHYQLLFVNRENGGLLYIDLCSPSAGGGTGLKAGGPPCVRLGSVGGS